MFVKGPRHRMAATSEEGEDNQQQHWRTKQETGAMSGKQADIIRDPRTDSQVGHKVDRTFQTFHVFNAFHNITGFLYYLSSLCSTFTNLGLRMVLIICTIHLPSQIWTKISPFCVKLLCFCHYLGFFSRSCGIPLFL
jgi:hypothetical protein